MKNLLVIPVFAMFFLALTTQLVDIADATSDKAILFAEDMSNSIDCAIAAVPLTKCSPNIGQYDFSEEQMQFEAVLNDTRAELEPIIEDYFGVRFRG